MRWALVQKQQSWSSSLWKSCLFSWSEPPEPPPRSPCVPWDCAQPQPSKSPSLTSAPQHKRDKMNQMYSLRSQLKLKLWHSTLKELIKCMKRGSSNHFKDVKWRFSSNEIYSDTDHWKAQIWVLGRHIWMTVLFLNSVYLAPENNEVIFLAPSEQSPMNLLMSSLLVHDCTLHKAYQKCVTAIHNPHRNL